MNRAGGCVTTQNPALTTDPSVERSRGCVAPYLGSRPPRQRSHNSHPGGCVMAVSKRLRFEILRRDNHTCRYCGRSAPEVKLTVDHVKPEALGGRTEPDNLVAACSDCNAGKT